MKWDELDRKLRPFVAARVGQSADVDDVMQEILLRIHAQVDTVRDEARLSGWLFTVARNAVFDHHRAQARDPHLIVEAMPERTADLELVDVIEPLLAQALSGFVGELPLKYREAIELTELGGLTQKAAAAQAGLSVSGMKSRVQRGRAQLLEMLHECCAIELDRRGHVLDCDPRGNCRCD